MRFRENAPCVRYDRIGYFISTGPIEQTRMGESMAKYYIGIDGGGTKTKVLCLNRDGDVCGEALLLGSYCAQDGVDVVTGRLRDGIRQCLPKGETDALIGFGMPAFGEQKDLDEIAVREIQNALAPMKVYFNNDSVTGWAGALAMEPGISIVGGTGSIGYGRDRFGNAARCGGWHEFFSDEGSGYWLGKRLLQLFSQQSDGRLPRTSLYDLVRERLALEDDFEITELVQKQYASSRMHTAKLQTILLDAARMGDPYAAESYDQASDELCRIILTLLQKLTFPADEPVPVSFQGGLFSIVDFIRQPVERKLRAATWSGNLLFFEPKMDPCRGAALLAIEAFEPEKLEVMKEKFSRSCLL